MGKVSALSLLSAPALEDRLHVVDDPSGTPVSYGLPLERLGGLVLPGLVGHRLTTESAVPVSTSDRTSQSTLYFTPFEHGRIVLYDGSRWVLLALTEIALALSGLTSGKNYDVFAFTSSATPSSTNTSTDVLTFGSATGWATGSQVVVSATAGGLTKGTVYYWNAASSTTGTLHTTLANALAGTSKVDLTASITASLTAISLELSAAWTDDTTRADALTTLDGVRVKSGATSRLLVGTIRTTGTTTTEDSAAKRFVSNLFNRVPRHMRVVEATNSWASSSGTRQLNASAANQVAYVNVLAGLGSHSTRVSAFSRNSAGSSSVGVGVDSTSAVTGLQNMNAFATDNYCVAFCMGPLLLGYHYLAALEVSSNGSGTWYGDTWPSGSTAGYQQSGIESLIEG